MKQANIICYDKKQKKKKTKQNKKKGANLIVYEEKIHEIYRREIHDTVKEASGKRKRMICTTAFQLISGKFTSKRIKGQR